MTLSPLQTPLSIAPMIDWTYPHFRVLMRYLAPNALLYTEMQTPGAIQHNPTRALAYFPVEKPVALQLGGADKQQLVDSAKRAEAAGFDEVNLNLGCPSDRVQAGRFGACLMAEPEHVAECLSAIKEAVSLPVSAKTRIGIDNDDSYEFFAHFVSHIAASGCDKLIVHARKAWLKGLNPKQNRTLPPLHYPYVYQIKKSLPTMPVVINGNISSVSESLTHLKQVDGVMLGRLACDNPYEIARIHQALYPTIPLPSREEVLTRYVAHCHSLDWGKEAVSFLLKPILTLAHGLPGAKQWKARLMGIQQSKELGELLKLPDYIRSLE